MKKLLIPFIFFLLIGTANAWMSLGIAGGKDGTVADTNFCAGYSGLFCEDFESNQTCGDDAASQANCRNASGWSIPSGGAGGTVTNQATGLAGSYSKYLNATQDATLVYRVNASYTATDDVWAYAIVKIDSLTMSGSAKNGALLSILSATSTTICAAFIIVAGDGTTRYFNAYSSTATASTIQPVQGTTYAIWVRAKNNTATTGCQIYVAEATCTGTPPVCTATKPSVSAQRTSQDAGGNPAQVRIYSKDDTSWGHIDQISYDNVKIKSSSIGDDGI
jgi:hypothetical protein